MHCLLQVLEINSYTECIMHALHSSYLSFLTVCLIEYSYGNLSTTTGLQKEDRLSTTAKLLADWNISPLDIYPGADLVYTFIYDLSHLFIMFFGTLSTLNITT